MSVADTASFVQPHTQTLRRALQAATDPSTVADLLFLESWELQGRLELGSILRASQIRRANPRLAAELAAEIATR